MPQPPHPFPRLLRRWDGDLRLHGIAVRSFNKIPALLKEAHAVDFADSSAGGNGRVEVFQWWKDSSVRSQYDNFTITYACEAGCVKVVQWWKERGIEAKYHFSAMDQPGKPKRPTEVLNGGGTAG
ncbi:hypothetical protein DFJ73DRAFT_800735 [Zopfochytrium polystomum]|nr:hypothetical protein DFJ73DRAFT_800735 [Zopfochytrium polystomum]